MENNLPEIKGRKWVSICGTMYTIPLKVYYILTDIDTTKERHNNDIATPLNIMVFDNGEPRYDVRGFKLVADVNEIFCPVLELRVLVREFELEVHSLVKEVQYNG